MDIRVKQRSTYVRNSLWRWAVWLEGPDSDLDKIAYVEYTLHSTFPDPVRRVTRRSHGVSVPFVTRRNEGYRLESAGWGEFMIYIEVVTKSEEVLNLQHYLRLDQPETGEPPEERQRSVFISSGIADSTFASELRAAIEEHGIEVWVDSDLKAGQSWESTIDSRIQRANAAVVVVSDRTSPWVVREVEEMRSQGLPLIPVVVGSVQELPPHLARCVWPSCSAVVHLSL